MMNGYLDEYFMSMYTLYYLRSSYVYAIYYIHYTYNACMYYKCLHYVYVDVYNIEYDEYII